MTDRHERIDLVVSWHEDLFYLVEVHGDVEGAELLFYGEPFGVVVDGGVLGVEVGYAAVKVFEVAELVV